jgi:hypothetical protein
MMKLSFNFKLILTGAILLLIASASPVFGANVKNTSNGFMVYNLTRYDNGNLTLNNVTFSIYVNYLTPNYAGIRINNVTYVVYPANVINIKNSSHNHYYINMTKLSWTPILQSFDLNLYDIVSPSNSITIVNKTTVKSTTTKSTSSISVPSTSISTVTPKIKVTNTIIQSNTLTTPKNNSSAKTALKTSGLTFKDYAAISVAAFIFIILLVFVFFHMKRNSAIGS